ncbi:hypothetical protein [Candidatus Villigracilis affinis]|uniref:hypothetical protein n=1 Tax=Candidatus Villigracilis affinis TaxID=3140682 RepID=UPI002A1F7880|nr:hypothetical protein [Anaerolineales bacterium]
MRRIFLLFFLLVTACSQPATQTATALPVNTPASTMPPAEVPTATVTPIPIPAREKYTLNTFIDYDLHFIDVAETIVYPNHTGQQLTSLTLAVAPNFGRTVFMSWK